MIRPMDLEYILISMELNIKDIGKMINKMEKDAKVGLKELVMREIM